MARFTKIYEDGTIKNVLTFRGKEFTITMGEWNGGVRESEEECLGEQLKKTFPDDENIDDISDAADILDYADEEEIEDALAELNDYELSRLSKMAKQIKFRVWDKDLKCMHVCGEDVHDSMSFLDNVACYYNLQNGCGSLPDGTGTYELMQYTGLKDKNSREIFEGDIVRRTCNLVGAVHDGFVGIVKFECAAFLLESFDGKGGRYLWDDVQELEVLGNIYEKPELLKEVEQK